MVLLVRARMVFTITVAMGDYDLLRSAVTSKMSAVGDRERFVLER